MAALLALVAQLASKAEITLPNDGILEKVIRAIDHVASQDWEAETLTKIAFHESGFRARITNCTIVGKIGDREIFQVVPRTRGDMSDACSYDYEVQARLALSRVRESVTMCDKQGYRGSDLLSAYTTGRCRRNEQSSKLRYGDGSFVSNSR